jgi:hypothetical protein
MDAFCGSEARVLAVGITCEFLMLSGIDFLTSLYESNIHLRKHVRPRAYTFSYSSEVCLSCG